MGVSEVLSFLGCGAVEGSTAEFMKYLFQVKGCGFITVDTVEPSSFGVNVLFVWKYSRDSRWISDLKE